ncbi:ABC transporter ATP-binding protein [Ruminiclostridium herbifermentans]|uniref:ABC transporter ATP-binding protein n=1 Tax=Ruminiclostridium herbifermentans TaxID=2488810 RepID=A0A4U7JC91_9FIRM|nr:ABC transporter ATP-binding protein [Ruminiclostridium herbifermentans]QNU66345.1 ABC transporter ATP-binding protein [Ruminiclostridium herbifermentans]
MGLVDVKNLNKSYGDIKAVNDLSFQIDQGEIFGFLGPNGAGKTSTINMMIGLSRPTSGHIMIDGIDAIKDIKKVQKIIGIIPDENNLYDEMNGFDNLCLCASLYGIRRKEREKRAMELLELFDLTKAAKRPLKTYSKGMKRKLTIAAGIIHNPKILFLDEPTTGIDVESARQIRELILNLKKQGKTIFITTHYIEEAERICDRIAFIVNGKIVKVGTVTELMENVEHEHKIKMQLDSSIKYVKEELENKFVNCTVEIPDENSCLIISKERIALSPILQLLDNKGISVYEAKEIKPSLEDVFVKLTGIEASKLKKEKEKVGK